MIQYYSVTVLNTPVHETQGKTRKATVETISKQLEYITKGMQTILF